MSQRLFCRTDNRKLNKVEKPLTKDFSHNHATIYDSRADDFINETLLINVLYGNIQRCLTTYSNYNQSIFAWLLATHLLSRSSPSEPSQ